MAALADNIGILFKIKSDSSDATRDIAKVKGEIAGLGTSATTAGGGMAALANPAALAVAAVVAIGAAAVTAAVGLFRLTEAASEYGSKIFDASQKTGASVENIQALAFAAEQSGASFEKIEGAIAKFSTLLGQSALGNEKATDTLRQFGITATDVDGALSQAITSIAAMTDKTKQNAAAAVLFKDKTGDVVNVIREMGGDLPGVIKKLEDMGIMMSKEDAAAADAFGDSLGLLSTQVKLLGYKFATEFMPQVTGAIQSISRFLVNNKDIVKGWGRDIGAVISGVSNAFRILPQVVSGVFSAINILFGTSLSTTASWANGMRFILGPIGEMFRMLNPVGSIGGDIANAANTASSSVMPPIATPKLNTGGGGKGGGKGGGGSSANDKARQEVEDQIQLQEIALKRLEKTYDATMESVRDAFKETRDQGAFGKDSLKAIDDYTNGVIKVRAELLKLEDKLMEGESDTKQRIRLAKQWDGVKEISDRIRKDAQENNKLLNEDDKARAEEQKKILKEVADFAKETSDSIHDQLVKNANVDLAKAKEVYNDAVKNTRLNKEQKLEALRVLQAEQTKFFIAMTIEEKARFDNAKIELDNWRTAKEKEIKETIKDEDELAGALQAVSDLYEQRLQLLKDTNKERRDAIDLEAPAIPVGDPIPELPYRPFQSWIDSYRDFVDQVAASAPTLSQTIQGIGGLFVNAFQGMAQAIGSVVQNWVLMGTTGPAVMRKILATALASIAAEAAVRAIWELALGFATLFTNPAESSGHFISAALFGSIAVGAALAGRAVAGDAFKSQTASATGGGGSGGGNGSNANGDNRQYTTEFGGYGTGQNPLKALIERQNTVLGQVEETIHQFNRKVTSMPASEIVAIGASDASREIRHAYESELHDSVSATDRLMRGTGLAR